MTTDEPDSPRARLFGDSKRRGNRGPSDELAPLLGEISDDVLWGRIWADEALDLRTRSLCTLSAMVAMERMEYARVHIRGARRIGVTKEELSALALQLLFYVGIPVVHNFLAMIKTVYDEPAGTHGHAWPAEG